MNELISLMYVSITTHEPSPEDIDHLLTKAVARNKEQDVTGVLLYRAGFFMQYIEGPERGMGIVYKAIQEDLLHTGIIELLCEPTTYRRFPDWAMAYKASLNSKISESRLFEEVLATKNGTLESEFPVEELMLRFWSSPSFSKKLIGDTQNVCTN